MLGSCPRSCDQCALSGVVKVPAWARGLSLAHGEKPQPMRKLGAPLATGAVGTSVPGPSEVEHHAERASLVHRLGLDKQAASKRLVGADVVAGMNDGVPSAVGRALNVSLGTRVGDLRKRRAAETLNAMGGDAAAADPSSTSEQHTPAAAESKGGGDPDASRNEGSLATLRWQMIVGWVAILALCGLVVGRRFCRSKRSPKGMGMKRGV